MKSELAPELISAIEQTIPQMEGKDSMEIEGSNKITLVRIGTEAFKEREKDESIMLVNFDDMFCIATK